MNNNEEPIRIAQIIGYMNGAGVEAVVANYYKFINKSKIQFDFICCEGSTNIPYEEIERLGGKVYIIPSYKKFFSYQKQIRKIFKNNNYKIVHSHVNTLSVFPLLAAKSVGIPIRIAHSHSSSNKKEIIRNIIKNVLKLFSKMFATNYVCCSEYAGRWLFGNDVFDKGQVYLLNNAIDLEKFAYNENIRKELRNELNIDNDTFVVGHIGRFVKQKNHDFLIDIFKEFHDKVDNSILLLVGQGKLKKKVEKKVKRLNLDNNVIFLGQRDDANALYQVFDSFVLPSLYEGLPVVGIEAQASGLKCLFSNNMTQETKVLESTKFLPLNNNPKEWAEILINGIPSSRHSCVKEMSDKQFNIKEEAKQLEDYYIKLLDEKKLRKKKVMHLISTNVFSGAENVACQIINLFKNDDYEMIYVSPEGSNIDSLKKRNVIFYKLKSFNYLEIKKAIKAFEPDIIHSHDIKASIMAAICTKNLKIISHIHANHENMRKVCLKTIIYNLFSSRFSSIIWVSQSAYDNYIFKNKVKEKSKIIYNVIDSNDIHNRVSDDESDYDNFDLVYLGRLTYQKNPQKLLSIIKIIVTKNPKIKVAIIGTGELSEEVDKMIESFNIKKNVTMFGFVSNPYKILSNSKLMIMTSRYEGTPMCALEAISLGIPIISTPTDGLKNIINNGINGYLLEEDADFANVILKLLNETREYEILKENTLKINRIVNDTNLFKNKIEELYNAEYGKE